MVLRSVNSSVVLPGQGDPLVLASVQYLGPPLSAAVVNFGARCRLLGVGLSVLLFVGLRKGAAGRARVYFNENVLTGFLNDVVDLSGVSVTDLVDGDVLQLMADVNVPGLVELQANGLTVVIL